MSSTFPDPRGAGSLDSEGLPKDVFAPSERDRIVQAMAATCAERGYRETTVEAVIERAGVSPAVFAANFSGTEDCGLAAVNLILAEATAVASGAWSPDASEWESIFRGVRALLELMAARPSFAHLAYIQARQAMPPNSYEPYASGVKVVASMIDRLRTYSPTEAPPPSAISRAVVGSAEMLIRRALVADEPERLPQLLPDIIYGVLVPYLGQEEAARYMGMARDALESS
jgi:AcrR family transcriptional regulator